MLARFGAAGGVHLFEYADKEETQGKKGKAHRIQRRVKRDHRNKRALSALEAGLDVAPAPQRLPRLQVPATALVGDSCRSATGTYVPGVEPQLAKSIRVNYAHNAQ